MSSIYDFLSHLQIRSKKGKNWKYIQVLIFIYLPWRFFLQNLDTLNSDDVLFSLYFIIFSLYIIEVLHDNLIAHFLLILANNSTHFLLSHYISNFGHKNKPSVLTVLLFSSVVQAFQKFLPPPMLSYKKQSKKKYYVNIEYAVICVIYKCVIWFALVNFWCGEIIFI